MTGPSAWTSVRDAGLVARFEVLRALRTWRALALIVLYVVATAGGTYVFIQFVGALEEGIAITLAVPTTDRPGTLLAHLLEDAQFRRVLAGMIGNAELVDEVLRYPILAVFHLWLGLLLVPFFAASTSAESISIDLGTRALRFEALRTGRLELVTGRFIGQALLTFVASGLGIAGTLVVALLFFAQVDPVELTTALGWLTVRAWAFGLPFVGLGVACSQWTGTPNWARVAAIGGTAGSWVLYGVARYYLPGRWGWLWDLVLQVLPQHWMRGLWDPDRWVLSCAVCVALGLAVPMLGYVRFARRDL